jgi:hypothetical protein
MLLIEELIESYTKILNNSVLNIFELIEKAILEHRDKFEDANREQLKHGLSALDEKITAPSNLPYQFYAPFTVREKKRKNQEHKFITLKDSGDFHKSITMKLTPDGFSLDATDPKKNKLVIKYGEEVLGITEANLNILLKGQIVPELISIIKNQLTNERI